MSREIKFRAWTDSWGMVYFNTGGFTIDVQSKTVWKDTMDEECVELQQYTGLKDSTGKEIYEGDLIKLADSPYVYEVSWDIWRLVITEVSGLIERQGMTSAVFNRAEIIGNIFETPELLA